MNQVRAATAEKVYRGLLLAMAAFFIFEFIIHFFGLPVIEHDEIFIPTHDRYIALYGLTLGGLFALLATSHRDDKTLYKFTLTAAFLGGLNAVYISLTDAYQKQFDVTDIDSQIGLLGLGILVWYLALKTASYYAFKSDVRNLTENDREGW